MGAAYKTYRYASGAMSDMDVALSLVVLAKYGASPSKDVNSMSKAELTSYLQKLQKAKLDSTNQSDEKIIDKWIDWVAEELALKNVTSVDVNTGGGTKPWSPIKPPSNTGGNVLTQNQTVTDEDNKWPLWKILLAVGGGVLVLGGAVLGIYYASKGGKSKKAKV